MTFGVVRIGGGDHDSSEEDIIHTDAHEHRFLTTTMAPFKCEDSLTKFVTSLGETRGCMWVGAYKIQRCPDPIAQAKCPVTCGTCPKPIVPTPHPSRSPTFAPTQCKDLVGKFMIQGENRGCIWVGAYKSIRCTDPVAQAKCPITCDTCPKPIVPTPVPSLVPTSSPTSCKDLLGKFMVDGEMRGCIWVDAYKSIRCNYPIAQERCPVTCNTCPTPVVPTSVPTLVPTQSPTQCKDLNGKYTIQGDTHGCIWVAAFKRDRCTDPVAQAKCPVTCGTCPAQPTQLPSKAPLSVPTAKPVAVVSLKPTSQPVAIPTALPSAKPSNKPSPRPSARPTVQPTSKPTIEPTLKPSSKPSAKQTDKPSAKPTLKPSGKPSARPTTKPTLKPSAKPSAKPMAKPSAKPTTKPSLCVDSKAIFRWHNDKARDCIWVSKHTSACSYDIARINCPVTCGACPSPSSQPIRSGSNQPTLRPSLSLSLSMGYKKILSKRPSIRPVARNLTQEEFFY
jgi:hypothetical protein